MAQEAPPLGLLAALACKKKMAGTESIIHYLGCGEDVSNKLPEQEKYKLVSKSESGVLSTWISVLERQSMFRDFYS